MAGGDEGPSAWRAVAAMESLPLASEPFVSVMMLPARAKGTPSNRSASAAKAPRRSTLVKGKVAIRQRENGREYGGAPIRPDAFCVTVEAGVPIAHVALRGHVLQQILLAEGLVVILPRAAAD